MACNIEASTCLLNNQNRKNRHAFQDTSTVDPNYQTVLLLLTSRIIIDAIIIINLDDNATVFERHVEHDQNSVHRCSLNLNP
jgi:hypothetical protein